MIRALNLSKTYYQGKANIEAVKNVNLLIQKGQSVLIAGPSGAGKSTLLHLLGGLEKPTKGAAASGGMEIGFVFQFYHLLPEFTALENVMLPALIKRKKTRERIGDITARAKRLLGLVGLAGRINHAPGELSGGESQRAAIARALVNTPEALLCDEPTGNLDSKTGEEVIECLWALKKKENMALVMVTHDEHIKNSFDRRFKMQDGIIEEIVDGVRYGPESIFEWKASR